MSSICLYDIDLLHGKSSSPPNFELMKIFNYHYLKGDIVNLARKKDDFGRYDQIIYFKQSLNLKIPRSLDLIGEKKQIYGYGFYGQFRELTNKYRSVAPNFLIYNINDDLIKNQKFYNEVRNNSIIRLQNEDYTYYKEDSKIVFIADEQISAGDERLKTIKKLKDKHQVDFLHGIVAANEQDFIALFNLFQSGKRKITSHFKFSFPFFKSFVTESKCIFDLSYFFEEDYKKGLYNYILMILYSKSLNVTFRSGAFTFNALEVKQNPILNLAPLIEKWKKDKRQISFYSYCNLYNQMDIFNRYLTYEDNIRKLSKLDPNSFRSEGIDFL